MPPKKDKVINKLTSQQETLKMAAFFSRKDSTKTELLFGWLAAAIFYGVSFGFIIYLFVFA